ncbi:C-type lectin domain family 2 member B-like isoform X1 [Pleurodeles waltl]|uniref:C-type lectin domain family 2 member B-like isoform X1 n=1 Tax=Pleurodeles waltl TaxID=8319 RepID=UPI0037099E32
MEGENGMPMTPRKRSPDHDDSGVGFSDGQTPSGQTPSSDQTHPNDQSPVRKRLGFAGDALGKNGVSSEEKERLRSSEETDGHQARPRNQSHGAWTQERRLPIALITLLCALLVISVVHVCLTVSCLQDLRLSASLPPCPKDWIWTNGACYFFSNEKNNWNKSQEFCASHDGTLAIILDQHTLDTIRRYKTIDNSWIGLRRRDGVWLWVNGTLFSGSLLPMAEDVPNLHCAYLNDDKYGVLDCASLRNWICIRNSSFSKSILH